MRRHLLAYLCSTFFLVCTTSHAATLEWTARELDQFYNYTATASGRFYIPDGTAPGIVRAELQDFTVSSPLPLKPGPSNQPIYADPGVRGVFVGLSDPVFQWDGSNILGITRLYTGLDYRDDQGITWSISGSYPYVGEFWAYAPYQNFPRLKTSFGSFTTHPGGASELGSHSVPEPSSFALLGLGGLGLAICAYRRRHFSVRSKRLEHDPSL
jgi:hypothetical protein